MTNNYAEGYPGRRYYGGCEHVDTVEEPAVQWAKELFSACRALKPRLPSECALGLTAGSGRGGRKQAFDRLASCEPRARTFPVSVGPIEYVNSADALRHA